MTDKRKALLLLGDLTVLVGSFYLTILLGYWGDFDASTIRSHSLPFSIMYAFWILIVYLFSLYDYSHIKPTIGNIRNISVALISCGAIGIIFFYLIPIFGISPKINLLINVLVFGLLFIGWRRIFFALFSKYFRKKTFILGRNQKSEELAEEMKKHPHIGYEFVDFIENTEDQTILDQAATIVVAKDFAFDAKNTRNLFSSGVDVMSIIEAYEKIFHRIPIEFITESWFLENIRKPNKKAPLFLKRFVETILSVIIFTVMLPFLLITAIIIKIEDGRAIFYKQKRVGKHNQDFHLYKFQSMIEGAEKNGPQWSQQNDKRITPFGKILRRTHIDELPQLLNIIRGDISLVGPRPERPEFVKELETKIPHFHLRHIVKPGITGWAQVKFKYAGNVLDSYEKFEYDMYYIKNQNIFMDLGIIFRTLQKLF